MNEFWLPAVSLLVIASLFVVIPVLIHYRRLHNSSEAIDNTPVAKDNRTIQNIAIYKDRKAELESELAIKNISQQQFDLLLEELESNLLEDAESTQDTVPEHKVSTKPGLFSAVSISVLSIVLILACSLGLYLKFGAYDDVVAYKTHGAQAQEIAAATEQAKNGDMSGLIEQLHARLKEAPDNIQGWGLLARTAMNTNRYAIAVEAFEQVIRLLESSAETLPQELGAAYGILAQAQYYTSQGVMDAPIKASIDKALGFNPNESNALSLLAIDAFTAQDYEQAISRWQAILQHYPDHPAKSSMERGINEAESRLGLALTKFNQADAMQIDIAVSLAPEIMEKAKPDDTLFIFVKNAQQDAGPPLAASRHTVSELPISISLSDKDAMSPMAKISDAQKVNVIARVSKSGQVNASQGDIEGAVLDLVITNGSSIDAEIVINTLIK
jgi:cytochrome c-type biogenesis protein CcmH